MNSSKVANALAKCVPLVTIAFLQDYLNCLNSKQALPNPKNYVPPMKESNVNAIDVSLSVNPARRHVFDGKKAQDCCNGWTVKVAASGNPQETPRKPPWGFPRIVA